MAIQPAVAFGVIIIGVAVVFLLAPLLITLANLRGIWRENLTNGVLLFSIVVTTMVFFALYFLGLFGVVFAPLER